MKAVNILKIKQVVLSGNQEKTPAAKRLLIWSCVRDFTNEAKRLLKTKGNVFPAAIKAKRLLKINELSVESQEVIDK